jgi:phosphatidylserine/phosphatidylglycerophosphate/cardiolipin synthase-like enzyme
LKKIILLFATILFAQEVYFMPLQGKTAEKKLFNLFAHAKNNIKITIYTFTNKKLAKALKIAARRGIKITIIADKKEAKFKYSVIPNLALIKNFNILLLTGKNYKNGDKAKMHVKMSIVDDKYLITGSANYTYSAFFKNYEYILISQNKELIKKFNNFFYYLKEKSTPYRLSKYSSNRVKNVLDFF